MANNNLSAYNVLRAFANDSNEFTERFSQMTQDNFKEYANAVLEFPVLRNEFAHYLINKIGRTYVNAMISKNPLAFLRGEDLPFGSTIEDMFVEIASAQDFDPEGKETLDRKLPDIKVLYYTKNVNLEYKVSISDKELKKAFFDSGQMGALIERISSSLYEGARHDAFIFLKELIAGYDGFTFQRVDALDGTEAKAKALGASLKTGILYAGFDSKNLNSAGVMNNIPSGEGILITNVPTSVGLDFDFLANVFNITRTELDSQIVIVDNFNANTDYVAIYADRRLFQVHYLYENIETQRNTSGRFTNYSLVIEAIYSMSKFMNAIAFTTTAAADLLPVSFNANGGTGSMDTRYFVNGRPFSTPFNSFKPPAGKRFSHWNTLSDGSGSSYAEISDITATAAVILFPIWVDA